jgi:tetratricopeptide (TPR) repeat protein
VAKLAVAGEHARLARRHAEHFCDQAQAADLLRGTGSTSEWLAAMELDLDNYRAAMQWSLTDGHDAALGAAVAGGLGWLWFAGGLSAEGRNWVDRAQAGLDESAHPKETAGLWLARCRLSVGRALRECAERAVTLYAAVGDARGSAWALYYLAGGLFDMGRFDEASEMFGTAFAAMRTLRDKRGEADCLNLQAGSQWNRGHTSAARDLYAQALEINKSLGDDDGTAIVLANLAELAFAAGQTVEAISLMSDALEILTPEKNITHLATDNINMAAYRVASGDVDGARVSVREGLRWARQAQYPLLIAIALQHLALLAAQRKVDDRAAHLLGYVDAQFRELGYERQPTEKWGYVKVTTTLRERLSDAEIEKLAAEGATWSEDTAVEEALKI